MSTFENMTIHKPKKSRDFTITESNPNFPDAAVENIADFIRWRTAQIALCHQNLGRSLYAMFPLKSRMEKAVAAKVKGAGGIRRESDGLHLYPPKPQRQFSPARQPHFVMHDGFELVAKLGSRKAMLTALAAQSANEYRLHQKACEHGIGLPPILYGKFDGETDFEGRETGAVAIAMDPHYRTVAEENAFQLYMHNGELCAAYSSAEKTILTTLSISAKLQTFLYALMARTKRKAIMEAGIVRHAGHIGNYLINQTTKHTLITDLDTAADISTIDQQSRPYQILRDVSHDLWRCISRYMLDYRMAEGAIDALQMNKSNPFHGFLSGYFGASVEATKIQAVSRRLAADFTAFLQKNGAEMKRLLDLHKEVRNGFSQSCFTVSMYPFFKHCITACYRLMREDTDAQNRGYSLPYIAETELEEKSEAGIQMFFEIAERESEEASMKMERDEKKPSDYLVSHH